MPMPGGGSYWIAKAGEEPVGGIFDISGSEFGPVPESWMSYIAVDDVDARVAKGRDGRRQADEAGFRGAGGRSHRRSHGAGRRRHRLDDAGEVLIWRSPCSTRSYRNPNGFRRVRNCSPRRRNSPRRATRSAPPDASCPGSRSRRTTCSTAQAASNRSPTCSTAAASSSSITSCSDRIGKPAVRTVLIGPTASIRSSI